MLDELQQSAASPSARRTSRTCRHRAGHFNLLTTNARYVHNKGLVGNAMFCYCHISLCAKVGNRSNFTPWSAFVGFTNVGCQDWSNIDNLRRISLGRASCLVPRASRLAPRASRLAPRASSQHVRPPSHTEVEMFIAESYLKYPISNKCMCCCYGHSL